MELIFNPCGKFWWSPEGPVSQIHSPHLYVGAPGIISLLTSIQILKRECGAESIGKLPYLFIPGKTAHLVPEFAVEDLRSAELQPCVPALAVKNRPWAEQWWLLNFRPNWKKSIDKCPVLSFRKYGHIILDLLLWTPNAITHGPPLVYSISCSNHSLGCLPQPGTKRWGEGILRMEDAGGLRKMTTQAVRIPIYL